MECRRDSLRPSPLDNQVLVPLDKPRVKLGVSRLTQRGNPLGSLQSSRPDNPLDSQRDSQRCALHVQAGSPRGSQRIQQVSPRDSPQGSLLVSPRGSPLASLADNPQHVPRGSRRRSLLASLAFLRASPQAYPRACPRPRPQLRLANPRVSPLRSRAGSLRDGQLVVPHRSPLVNPLDSQRVSRQDSPQDSRLVALLGNRAGSP